MKSRSMVLLLWFLTCTAAGARSQSILISSSSWEWNCNVYIQPSVRTTWYVMAVHGGAVQDGMFGAEFRLEGIPADWIVAATPSSAASFVMGSPHRGTPRGVNIAFTECQRGNALGMVLLFTYDVIPTSPADNNCLWIARHEAPSNPALQCPVLVACDAPTYTGYCAAGIEAVMNGCCLCDPPPFPPCNPIVPVTSESWSGVKALYR